MCSVVQPLTDQSFSPNLYSITFTEKSFIFRRFLPKLRHSNHLKNDAELVRVPEAKQMFEFLIPRGTMGRPEEIAAAALFLASEGSSFVNGMEFCVDGGFSAI